MIYGFSSAQDRQLSNTIGIEGVFSGIKEVFETDQGKVIELDVVQPSPAAPGVAEISSSDCVTRIVDLLNNSSNIKFLCAAFDEIPIGLCLFDQAGVLVFANAAYASLYHLPPSAVKRGLSLRETITERLSGNVTPETNDDDYPDMIEGALKTNGMLAGLLEYQNDRIFDVTYRSLHGKGAIGLHQDITDHSKLAKKIDRLANLDQLTNLPNQTKLRLEIKQAFETERNFALIIIDIDHFKEINDLLGRKRGDQLIADAADRISESISGQHFLARLDGARFAILCHNSDQSQCDAISQGVIHSLLRTFKSGESEIFLRASIGIATSSQARDPEQLIYYCKLAVSHAKANGRGRIQFFEPRLFIEKYERGQLSRDLRDALEKQEFDLAYQPIVDAKTERIIRFEALLRWKHPTRGLVDPGKFIPIAEDIGIMPTLGEWVLKKSCSACRRWPSHIGVSVNMSASQFKVGDVAEIVSHALSDTGLPPARLEVELTESIMLGDEEEVRRQIERLRKLGVRVALDDFGTGYSCLGYLSSLPFDKIKIDKRFLDNCKSSKHGLQILEAIVGIANILDLDTTVEGVETSAQLKVLQIVGVTEIQGFLFGRPMTFEQTETLIRNQEHSLEGPDAPHSRRA